MSMSIMPHKFLIQKKSLQIVSLLSNLYIFVESLIIKCELHSGYTHLLVYASGKYQHIALESPRSCWAQTHSQHTLQEDSSERPGIHPVPRFSHNS